MTYVKKQVIMVAVLLALLTPLVSAEIIIFDKYETTMHSEDGKLHVTKQLRLKNVGGNPIIPGEIHFKISEESRGEAVTPVVTDFVVTNKFDKSLDTRQVTTDAGVDLIFTVWDPLLPDFFYDMTMEYTLDFSPSGLLFYQINLPEERTTIPIKKATTTFSLPKQFSITYAPNGEVKSEDGTQTVTWDGKDSYSVEYSLIPFPRLGFRAVNVFWVIVIVVFTIHLIFRIRKKAKMANSL